MKIEIKNAKNSVKSSAYLALHKDVILKTPKKRSQIRVMEVKKVTYGEIL